MSYNTITRYLKCDIDRSYGDIQPLGYEKTKTEGEMIDLACLHGCKVIVKNGINGKWYLKGKTKTAYVQATEKYGKNTINIGIGLIFISLSLAGGGLLYYYMNKNKK